MEPRQQRFSIGYLIVTMIALVLLQSVLFATHRETLTYSEFKALVTASKVRDLVLDRQTITGSVVADGLDSLLPKQKLEELKRYGGGPHAFVTARVDDPGLVPALEAARVRFAGRVENTWCAELLDRMDVLLGGRVAEEIVFGDVSTGAQDDLQRATDLARHMVARYGMSDGVGLATVERPRPALFLEVPSATPREYSEETARRIDAEIGMPLEASHERVRETLTAQRTTLEALAKLLIEHEVVDRAALAQLLGSSGSGQAAVGVTSEGTR